uniref:Uncharacterized protein n=2 Tax=Aplanochytrium stocchinoi TaxID=215587 RepID=A0A7S3V1M8_9STRA|mmetsp:Transcript_34462/g.42465  ORF Transcript_34462/g.42465 Transcript_34462/m.42465 type:complete len:124 (-) Transcript_34462:1072-1443(-)
MRRINVLDTTSKFKQHMATNGGYELEEARGKEKGRVRNTRCSIDKVKLMAAEVAQIPSYLKEEKVFRYDSERHDLRSVVARILQVTPESLHRIHELVEFRGPQRAGKPILFHKSSNYLNLICA